MTARIIYNRLLAGWFIVRGPHDTPISGKFPTKKAALLHQHAYRGHVPDSALKYNPEFLGAQPPRAGEDY